MKIEKQLKNVLEASRKINLTDEQVIINVLLELADQTESRIDFILTENKKDLDRMDKEDPKYDRLKLTEKRIGGIAADIRNVAGLDTPVGRILKSSVRPNGLKIEKISVPFGVIGIIWRNMLPY